MYRYPVGFIFNNKDLRMNGPQEPAQSLSPVMSTIGLGALDDPHSSRPKQAPMELTGTTVPQAAFTFPPGTALIAHPIPAPHQQQLNQFDASLQRHIAAQMHQNPIHAPIMLSTPHLQDLRMHLPDAAGFPYFPQSLIPVSRTDDFHRGAYSTPSGSGVLYPISTIFVSPENRTCCLLDRGTRCNRPAGTANFTIKIRELVTRSGALLTEDNVAGHQYICDYHKNYIQKLRIVVPSGPSPAPATPPNTVPSHSSGHTGQGQFSHTSHFPTFSGEPTASHGGVTMKPEESSHAGTEQDSKRMNGSPAHKPAGALAEGKIKEYSEPSSTPVDMRKAQSHETKVSSAKQSPDGGTDDSSEEEMLNGPAVADLLYGIGECFTTGDLLTYMKFFDIELPAHSTREELIRVFCEHIDSVSTGDPKSILTNFFHGLKTDTRPFNQSYKPGLNVDFDLSSDEEMMVMDGKEGMIPADSSSSDVEGISESDDEMDNGEDLPDIHFDEQMERTLNQIAGKFSVGDIERILEKYTLPVKFSALNHDSDSDSDASSEQKLKGERNFSRRRRKIRRPVVSP
ncbi:uncharacterized protein LOC129597061 [Paramacrobiotus metropolitanus]|uniref:uncharacterized protein LOC129597061 n=1 Tax=Paramacrobiotus metropolitanus TaxID=2943436 RepID=UPI002445F032|nr:uncharacterized protein LOC129597061 [Paramacrobiotus metropolitanus]